MMTSVRTIIDIPDKQLDALSDFCRKEGISRAEAVRQAVNRFLTESAPPPKDLGFGAWKHKRINSRKFVDKLRSEWSGNSEP